MTKTDEIKEIANALRRSYPKTYESGYDTWLRTFNEFHRLMMMIHPRTDGAYKLRELVDVNKEIFAEPAWGAPKLKQPRMLVEDIK